MKTLVACFFFAAGMLVASSCSQNRNPTESDAEIRLRDIVKEQSQAAMSLVTFEKTDGLSALTNGVSTYVMNFRATVQFEEDGIWLEANLVPVSGFKVARKITTGTGPGWDNYLYRATNPGVEGEAGDTFRIEGDIRFEKAERGWRVVGIRETKIYDKISVPRQDRDKVIGKGIPTSVAAAPAPERGASNAAVLVPKANAAVAVPRSGQPFTLFDLGIEFVPVAAGEFSMGSPGREKGRFDDETQHQVRISHPFWIATTEITEGLLEYLLPTVTPPISLEKAREYNRGGNTSWIRATELCRIITERELAAGRLPQGYVYTLPTEAQWEYACRAGTTGPYAGELDSMADYLSQKQIETNRFEEQKAVGRFKPNSWGIFDMHGGVKEWCLDYYGPYPSQLTVDPIGPVSGRLKILRGGSSSSTADRCRSAARESADPTKHDGGIRLVLSYRAAPLAPTDSTNTHNVKLSETRQIEITIGDDGVFDLNRIDGIVGEKVTIRLTNTGSLAKAAAGKSFVLLEKGTDIISFVKQSQRINESTSMTPKVVIAQTRTLGPRESDEITCQLPSEVGEYPYINGFSFGFMSGKGVLVVRRPGETPVPAK